jgi:hypothetical protein
MLNRPGNPDLVNQRWSIARCAGFVSATSLSGSLTTGIVFHVTRSGIRCVGMRFYAAVTGAKTVKAKLYDAAGTLQQTANVSAGSSGVFEAFWTTPLALTAFASYRVSTWQTDGVNYTNYIYANAHAPVVPFPAGGVVIITNAALSGAGDVAPITTDSGNGYPCEPILDGSF